MNSNGAREDAAARTSAAADDTSPARRRSTAAELLERREALLSRSHLRELGLERRAIDAIWRSLPVVALPGYSRTLIRVGDYLDLVERSTYRGDRVRQ
jgi:hypothetical protein